MTEHQTIPKRIEKKCICTTRSVGEDALSLEGYRSCELLDFFPDPVVLYTMDGKAVFVNREFEDTFGWSREEWIGQTIDYVPEENRAEADAAIRRLLEGKKSVAISTRRYTRHGRVLDVWLSASALCDSTGRSTGLIVVLQDIGKRRSAEQRLRLTERELRDREGRLRARELFEKAGDSIFILGADGTDAGRILAANQAAADMHGYTVEELQTMHIRQLDAPEERDKIASRLARMQNGEWITEELTHVTRTGIRFPVEISAGVIEHGDERHILAFDRDISERRRIEKQLIDSEERFRTIIENAGEGFLLADAETMLFTYANPAMCEYLGYSCSELAQLGVADIHPKEDLAQVVEEFAQLAKKEKTVSKNIPCLRKDGTIRYADIRSGRVMIDGRPHVLGFFADITDRLRAEQEREDQLALLQTLLETIPSPIFYKETGGRYLGCNSAFEKAMGRSRERIIGKSVNEIAPKELADLYREKDETLYAVGGTQTYETSFRFGDGSLHHVMVNKALFPTRDDRAGGIVGVILDLTETRRAERERVVLASAIEQSSDIIILLSRNGRITYVNDSMEKITGRDRGSVLGKSLSTLELGGEPATVFSTIDEALRKGQTWQGRLPCSSSTGALLQMEASISPVKQAEGVESTYVAVLRDVTTEILRERQFRQAQKMEAIGTLAGGIAHDFNNILSGIIGYSEMVLQDLPDGSSGRKSMKRVLEAADRAGDLVRQILTFSRQEGQEKQPVMLRLVVREALKLIRASIPPSIQIRQDLQSDAVILADPTQIHQIVMNLCTNSAHAIRPEGGVITVRLLEEERTGLGLSSRGEGGRLPRGVRFSVEDTGIGMPPDVLERIFDPFYTTKGPNEGTGMGLSVVHGIVDSHHGTIDVSSRPGEGTRFDILLPILEGDESAPAISGVPIPLGTERILFVDDEPFLNDIGKKVLGRLGYTVTGYSSSIEALEAFRSRPDAFDLVVTDMIMPNMSGEKLAEEILAIRPDIPIILSTGYSESFSEEALSKMGFRGLVMKPLVIKDLASLIREILD